MKIATFAKRAGIVAAALCMSVAPGLDMAVVAKLKPDAADLGGYLYQMIGRTFRSVSGDSIALAFLFFGSLWLARRYLFHKPERTGAGEYLLCGFMSAAMLCCASMRAAGSVQTLYENVFQLVKAALYLAGMFPLFLCALRGLNELLRRGPSPRRLRWWDAHPVAFPAAVLGLAWVAQVVVKYPGVINLDVVMPIRQYIGLTARANDFPVLGTLVYGLAYTLGQRMGNVNIPYFAMMLAQVLALYAVLCYALWLMKTRGASPWVCALSLALFAVSPIYIGWAVIIIKDAQYMILTLLLATLLIEMLLDVRAFFSKKSRWALLAVCLTLLVFTRYNGAYIAAPVLAACAAVAAAKRAGWRTLAGLALTACLVFGGTAGVNRAVINALDMREIKFYDWLSVPFQQTARVAALHGDDVSEEDKAAIDTMIRYDALAERYKPNRADAVKTTVSVLERGEQAPWRYLQVWWKQLKQYPMDYVDALLAMNYYMFDLQSNVPVYNSYADIESYIYPYAFHETQFFNLEEIRPLISWQLALTEWYFQFSDLPVIGWFASMGFCVHGLLAMLYLSWVNRRRGALLVMLPALITAVAGMFCPEVYVRYLLPVISSLPLWLGAYSLLGKARANQITPCAEAR